jgi:hypothetical protein
MTTQSANVIKITLGEFTYSYDLAFLACLGLALAVVFLFSTAKFGEPTIERNDEDPVSQLLPKFLATPQQYARALMVYILAMSAIVVVLSFLGPRVVSLGATDLPDAPTALPLVVALVLVGMFPNVPWLQEIERRLRRFAHQRAFIPTAARATAERLAAAEFDFSSYESAHVLNTCAMRGVEATDFHASRDSIEYAWARLSCLLYKLRQIQDADSAIALDGEVLARYAKDLDSLALKRKSLEIEIAHHRRDSAKPKYRGNEELHRAIRKTLRTLYVLIGCAVRLNLHTGTAANPTLRQFGFLLDPPTTTRDNENVMIVGLALMSVAIFAIVYAAVGLGQTGLWQPSASFPQQPLEPFKWAFSGLLAHGTAIYVADTVRSRWMTQGTWFGLHGRRDVANYVLVAVACAVAGFIVLYLWCLLQVGISWNLAVALAPYATLWATTGVAYVVHLDDVDLARPRSPGQAIAVQALVTGLCGFIAASASGGAAYDSVFVAVAFGAAIGATLAWYIPAGAARQKYDPLADARAHRVAALEAEARRFHDDQAAASDWLDQPIKALNHQTPRQAAYSLATFEKAVSLLREPKTAVQVCAARAASDVRRSPANRRSSRRRR